jgi:hypothetical protein
MARRRRGPQTQGNAHVSDRPSELSRSQSLNSDWLRVLTE